MVGIAAHAAIAIDNANLYGVAQREIDERRVAEERLRELNETLEQRVEVRTRERDRAWKYSRDLQAVVDDRGCFLEVSDAWYAVLGWQPAELGGHRAYEFIHPEDRPAGERPFLQPGQGPGIRKPHAPQGRQLSLHLLGLQRRLPEDASVRRQATNAMEAANRAAVLTQRLLAFARKQPLSPRAVDANALVTGMSELLRHALGADIRLEVRSADGLWPTLADANQLENAILNLAVNARDAMAEGGRLTIETANVKLDGRYVANHPELEAGDYLSITVTDSGIGMPAGVVRRAFDPFFTTKQAGQGTGLGLSQVYGFVKQSGGHVTIYSEPGRGTSVRIYLPRLAAPAGSREAADAMSASASVPIGQQELVLLVDDEAAVRQVNAEALRELGYRVLEADGADTAMTTLAAHPQVELLFTDLVMPDVDGRRLAAEARRHHPDLKVLFTTGYSPTAARQIGALDVEAPLLGKPFTLEELGRTLRQVLEGA